MLKIKSMKSNNIIVSKLKWKEIPEMSDLLQISPGLKLAIALYPFSVFEFGLLQHVSKEYLVTLVEAVTG